MATEFLRDKLSTLGNMVRTEAVQIFQHQMIAKGNSNPTGDSEVDANMKAEAQRALAFVAAASKRLEVYRADLALLEAEQDESEKQVVPE